MWGLANEAPVQCFSARLHITCLQGLLCSGRSILVDTARPKSHLGAVIHLKTEGILLSIACIRGKVFCAGASCSRVALLLASSAQPLAGVMMAVVVVTMIRTEKSGHRWNRLKRPPKNREHVAVVGVTMIRAAMRGKTCRLLYLHPINLWQVQCAYVVIPFACASDKRQLLPSLLQHRVYSRHEARHRCNYHRKIWQAEASTISHLLSRPRLLAYHNKADRNEFPSWTMVQNQTRTTCMPKYGLF